MDPFRVVLLALSTHHIIWLYFIARLKCLLLLDEIEVLRKTVDEITDKLLGILLPEPRKLRSDIPNDLFEFKRRD